MMKKKTIAKNPFSKTISAPKSKSKINFNDLKPSKAIPFESTDKCYKSSKPTKTFNKLKGISKELYKRKTPSL